MITAGSINFDTKVDTDGFKKGIGSLTEGIKSLTLAGVGLKAVSAAFDMIKGSVGSAMGRIDTMEQFGRTMTALTGSSGAAETALESVRTSVTGTAYGLDVAAKAVQGFVTSGMEIETATGQIETLADAVSFYGEGTNEALSTAAEAWSKIATSGKVSSVEIRSLTLAGIPVYKIYADAVGKSTEDVQKSLSDGTISAEEFQSTLTTALKDGTANFESVSGAAKAAGASWAGTFDNMRAAVTRGVQAIIENIDRGLSKASLSSMRDMVANLGKTFEKVLKGAASLAGALARSMQVLIPVIKTAGAAFLAWKAGAVITSLIGSFRSATAAVITYTAATAKGVAGELLMGSTLKTSQILIGVLTKSISLKTAWTLLATKAQLAYNAAMKANPVGVVLAAVAALVVAVVALTKATAKAGDADKERAARMEKLSAETDRLTKKNEELTKTVDGLETTHKDAIQAAETEAKVSKSLTDELVKLGNKTNKTKGEIALMSGWVDELNSSIPGLALNIDKETGALNMNAEEIYKVIKAKEALAKKNAEFEVYNDALKAQSEAEAQAAYLQRQRAKVSAELDAYLKRWGETQDSPAWVISLIGGGDLRKQLKELDAQIEINSQNLGTAKGMVEVYRDGIVGSFSETDEAVTESSKLTQGELEALAEKYNTTTDSVKESLDASGMTLEEWTKRQDDMSKSVERFSKYTQNMFGTIKQEAAISVGEMISNLEANQKAVDGWAENLRTLRGRVETMDVLTPLVDIFADLGPEYAGSLQNLVGATDEQLLRLIELIENNSMSATEAMRAVFGEESVIASGSTLIDDMAGGVSANDSLKTASEEAVTSAIGAMEKTVKDADVPSIGKNIVEGLAKGIRDNKHLAVNAMTEVSEAVNQTAKDVPKTESPSRVMRDEVGAMIAKGLAIGIKENSWEVTKATESMFDDLKLQHELGLLTDEEYYRSLTAYRSSYLEHGTKEWWDYTKTIMKYEDDLLKEHEKALEEEKKNIKSIYDDIAKYASGKIEDVIKLQESLAKKMQDYGSLATTVKIKYEGQEIEHKKLGDLQGDIDFLRAYGDELQNVKSRIAEAGFDSETVKDFFSVMANMSLDEGAEFARLLSTAAQEEFVSYISDWAEKQGLSDELSKQLYSDEFTDAVDDAAAYMTKELEKAGLEIPEGFFASGTLSAERFGEGFLETIDLQMRAIRDRIASFTSSLMPQLAFGSASSGNVYNTSNNATYVLNSSGETVSQQLQAADRHNTIERLRNG